VQVIFQALSLNFQKSGPPGPLSSVSTFHASLSMALRHMIAADPTFETPKGGCLPNGLPRKQFTSGSDICGGRLRGMRHR
jgi:hypothetical protein